MCQKKKTKKKAQGAMGSSKMQKIESQGTAINF